MPQVSLSQVEPIALSVVITGQLGSADTNVLEWIHVVMGGKI